MNVTWQKSAAVLLLLRASPFDLGRQVIDFGVHE